jgi:S-adenosyl-L-methionine hydrolase (adenosine-forming)
MPNGLITFTTDFGVSDHFVATMKGVVAGIAPKARVIDVTHDISPYSVTEAAFVISEAWTSFPKGTIHVIVVDPGVGSDRRPLLVEGGGHFFIAPDNGVLSMIFDAVPHKARVLTNPQFMLKVISRTFHGRDIFAPAAAHLAKGVKPAQFGKLIHDAVRADLASNTPLGNTSWRGSILKADRFGNLITSFSLVEFAGVKTRAFEVRVGNTKIHRLALNYAETALGDLFAIEGSSGYLEIASNQASAAAQLGCSAGAPVELDLY